VEIKPDVVQTGGQLPPPMFPPIVPADKEKPAPVAPLPAILETKPAPILTLPMPEPTKALIIDLPSKEVPKKGVDVQTGPSALPPVILNMDPMKGTSTPTPAPPIPILKNETVVSPPATIQVTDSPQVERPKSFIRIRAGGSDPAPVMPPVLRDPPPLAPPPALGPQPLPISPQPIGSGLANLQTPAVAVDKRGPATLRAGETQLFQIVIRNAGTVPAQQIRIEDDLPADVRLLNADPMPQMQGSKAIWTLPPLAPGSEQTLRLTLKADANVQLASSVSMHVSAASVTTRVANAPSALSIRLSGPEKVIVGKPAVFEIHLANPLRQPLTNIVLHGDLSDGLTTPAGSRIEGEVSDAIAPGDFKILKMPATAAKPGRYTVHAKVVTQAGEASATTIVDVTADSLFVQQAPTTRLALGRDGDLRIDIANHTGKPMRNVTVANLLPEGLTFMGASDRGLFSSNSRTVHWLIDNLPIGAAKTLVVRVNGAKAGQHQSLVSARADGVPEVRSAGSIVLEGAANLTLRVIDRDNPLELGRETVYEIQVQNPGNAPASNVQVQVQFPAGLIPKNAQGNTKFSIDRQTVTFEPIATLAAQGQVIYRVSAQAKTVGNDQRVRFALISDEVRTPIQREIGVMVYSGN